MYRKVYELVHLGSPTMSGFLFDEPDVNRLIEEHAGPPDGLLTTRTFDGARGQQTVRRLGADAGGNEKGTPVSPTPLPFDKLRERYDYASSAAAGSSMASRPGWRDVLNT